MRPIALLISIALLVSTLAPAARAGVNVERNGVENPMVEVSRSVIYGALAGLVVGGAFALASNEDNKGDIIRWSLAGGTAVGLVVGLYWVTHRPEPTGMLEWDRGAARLRIPSLALSPGGAIQAPVVAVRF